jgi:polysaccharide export outer membrane protein
MALGSLIRWAAMIGLAFTVSACSGTRGGSIPYNVSNFGMPDAPKPIVADEGYKLAPLDTVAINVYQVPDLSKDYSIDLSGRITMPLVGNISAIGMSTNELATQIQQKLGERYLRDPNVVVALKESKSRIVTVDGAVRQPGIFPAAGGMTLMQTVALARGTDDFANPKRVAVFRVIQGKRMAAAFDLTRIRRGEEEDPAIYAGDTVVVDGSNLRKAQRELFQAIPLLPIFMAF